MEKAYDKKVNVGEMLKNLLFPKMCLGCGKIGSYFCPNCRRHIPSLIRLDTICPVCTKPAVGGATHPRCQTRYSPDGLTTIFRYDGMVRKAIKLLKYQRMKDLVAELTTLIATISNSKEDMYVSINRFIEVNNPIISSVPLYKIRERERWFNQSEILAKSIAEKLQLEFQPDILVRTKFSKPQAGLLKEDRFKNIKNSFTINPKSPPLTPNSSFILFDDVWTTGATMRECVNVLKRGGVKKVWCLTVAR